MLSGSKPVPDPQFNGDRIVSPAEYVKLFMAAYRGIEAGDPNAVVAAGETSNRGRSKPTGGLGGGSVQRGARQAICMSAP